MAYSPCQKARDDGSGNAALLVLRAFNGQGYVEVRREQAGADGQLVGMNVQTGVTTGELQEQGKSQPDRGQSCSCTHADEHTDGYTAQDAPDQAAATGRSMWRGWSGCSRR